MDNSPNNRYDGTFLSSYQSVIDKYVPSYRKRRGSGDGELDLDVAAGGVGVGADLVGLLGELLGGRGVGAGDGHLELDGRPNPPWPLSPMLTSATTSESVMSTLALPATRLSAEWKQAA